VLAVLRAATGWDAPDALAASPDALAAGRVWLLPASGLIVAGAVPALQLASTALLVWVVVHRFGGAVFWGVAIAGHVGATVAAYTGILLVWLVDAHAARHVVAQPDYGISAVWAACAGAIAYAGLRGELRRSRLVAGLGAACLLTLLVLVPANGELSDIEHLLAFAGGGAVAALALHHGRRADRHPLRPSRLPSLRRRPRAASCPVR
jgi:hypothetical protein